MILRLIEVKNFLSHIEERLELQPKGIYLLQGESGAGKSSLVADAVGFALFGYRATRARTIGELKRDDHTGKDFHVRIAFELQDDLKVELTRGVKVNGASFVNIVDSQGGYAEGDQQVSARLRELIGVMDARTYFRSYVSRQDELASITDLDPKDRAEFIGRMLGIDLLDKLAMEYKRESRRLGAEIKRLEAELGASALPQIEAQHSLILHDMQEVEKEIKTLSEKTRSAQLQAEKIVRDLEPKEKAYEAWRSSRERLRLLEVEILGLKKDQEYLSSQAEQRENLQKEVAQIPSLKEDGIRARKRFEIWQNLDQIYQGHLQKKARLTEIQTRLDGFGEAKTLTVPDTETLLAKRGEISAALKFQQTQKTTLEQKLSELADANICSLCLRPLGEHEHEHVQVNYEKEIQACAQKLEIGKNRLLDLDKAIQDAQEMRKDFEKQKQVETERQILIKEKTSLEKELVNFNQEHDPKEGERLQEILADLRQKLRVSLAAETELLKTQDLETRSKELQKKLDEFEHELGILRPLTEIEPPDQNEIIHLRDQERTHRRDAQEASTAQLEHQARLNELKNTLSQNEKEKEAYTKAQKAIGREREELKKIKRLLDLTAAFKNELASTIRPQLEAIASEIMTNLSEGLYSGVEINEQYDINLRKPDGSVRSARLLSGGEKVRANFSLRLALTRLVTQRTGTPIRYIILDEVFAAQDPGHRERMMQVLNRIRGFYPQIFLISHVGDLDEAELVNYVIQVPNTDKPNRIKVLSV